MTGILDGKARGLEGDKLKRHVSKHFYPFGPRENTPYKLWLSELRQAFGDDARYYETPIVVARLTQWASSGPGRTWGWSGRSVGGEIVLIVHENSSVRVAIGAFSQEPMAQFDFHETDHPSITEIADRLQSTGLFDFSQVDLGPLEACS